MDSVTQILLGASVGVAVMGRRTALWLLAALVPLSVLSLMIGAAGIGVSTLLTDPQAALILTVSRLPRTMAVILTGAALAIGVLKGALACHSGMATFAEAGVSDG